ncbi:MAG: methyltransferase regulatory domain-containing protein, partial [Thiobacillus sp.]|nr:methyltransferase regulatory domain-containing protein [Thiobacillus sp.]
FPWGPPRGQQARGVVCRRQRPPPAMPNNRYTAPAGWSKPHPLRAALTERTAADLPAPARYAQALRVLDELAAEWTDPALLKEVAYLKAAAPSYLFHEYLADFNAPMAFVEFAAQLDTHGLRYVGEAGPRSAVVELEDAWGLMPEGMAGRWLDAEAALDDALAIRFRRALVARGDAPCAQPPQPAALCGLAFYADLRSDEEIDLEAVTEQGFVNPAGNTFPIAMPEMKAAAMALSAAYPGALDYAALLSATAQVLAQYGASPELDEAAFRDALLQVVLLHGVMPTVAAGLFAVEPGAVEPGERPCANALARQQANTPGWVVSGARHVAMDLDAPGRMLLGRLDGSRTVDELAAQMQAMLAQSGRDLPMERLRELTWQQLWLFARQGLLV